MLYYDLKIITQKGKSTVKEVAYRRHTAVLMSPHLGLKICGSLRGNRSSNSAHKGHVRHTIF